MQPSDEGKYEILHVIPARCVTVSTSGGRAGRLLDLVFGKAVRLYSATLLLCPPGSSRYGFITGTCSYFVLDGGLRQIAKEECATARAYIVLVVVAKARESWLAFVVVAASRLHWLT